VDDSDWLARWCKAMQDGWPCQEDVPAPRLVDGIVIFSGISLGMSTITYLALAIHLPVLVASFGASACLLFCVPKAPFAQPRNIIAGHILSAAVGVAFQNILGCTWYSAALSVGGATVAMLYSRTLHPPAAATALIAVLTTQGMLFPIYPVAVGATILVAAGRVISRLLPKVAQATVIYKKEG